MKIDCYENIYPRRLWVAIGDEIEQIKKTFAYSDGTELDIDSDTDVAYAITVDVLHKKTGLLGVLVWACDTESLSPKVMAHESVHATIEMFHACHCYFTYNNQEPFAYLTSWIFDKIQETKEKCLKKVK